MSPLPSSKAEVPNLVKLDKEPNKSVGIVEFAINGVILFQLKLYLFKILEHEQKKPPELNDFLEFYVLRHLKRCSKFCSFRSNSGAAFMEMAGMGQIYNFILTNYKAKFDEIRQANPNKAILQCEIVRSKINAIFQDKNEP